jgi:hypothetical protein
MPLTPLAPYKSPRRAAAARVSELFNMPAPVGGLNLRDSLALMSPQDAVILNNFIPRQQGVELRKGWQYSVDNITFATGSVFSFTAPDPADNKVFVAADGDIYDATANPAVVSANNTGSTDNIWWTTQFSTGATSFLLAVSPSGGYWTYDTAGGWVKRTPTNLPTNPRTVGVWKRRVWFTCEEDDNVYYMNDVNAITGTVTSFAMGAHLSRGGYVSATANWTLDAGTGIDDHLVVIGTQGDLMVWAGTDPTSANTFGLKGVWYVGPVPKHGRYFTPVGGDLMILSEMGLIPVSRLVNGQFIEGQPGPAFKIQTVLGPAVTDLRTVAEWNVLAVPSQDILLIKLPPSDNQYIQYAMNLTTGAWCSFTNFPMQSATVMNGQLYFSTNNNRVARGLYGNRDGVAVNGSGGDVVEGDIQTAFQTFGTPGQLKKFEMVRPIFLSGGAPTLKVLMNTQYRYDDVGGSPSYTEFNPPLWDSAIWNLARWSAQNGAFESWLGVSGVGYYGALRLKVRALPGTLFTSSHVMAQVGGVM